MSAKTVFAVLAISALTASVAASAATDGAATPPAHRHAMGFHRDGFMAALRQLDLSAEQQQSIRSLMQNARQQAKANASGQSVDRSALENPGDPNYAAAVSNAETTATKRIQQESYLKSQIYNLLTADQKAKLPQVLADMKAQAEQRRTEWQQKHNQSSAS